MYFRDVYDHVIRINETIDNLRELLTTALEANLSLIAVRQNEVMKKLAAWAAILAVPTLIAGIYGMNFESMPELHWRFGYLAAVAGMAGGVRRALRLVPARGVAVSSVARLVLRAIHRTVGRFLPHRPFSLGATHRCRARTVS